MNHNVPVSVKLSIFLALLLNTYFWSMAYPIFPKWPGVPPVPSESGAIGMTLGDKQFSYRMLAITVQNLGDTGGQITPLEDYDYNKLKNWFDLLYSLDSVSDHIPMTAAYYFGATRNPEKARKIAEYLAEIGNNPHGEKWRWLAHAVFLAKHRVKDLEYALELAYKLAALQTLDYEKPMWAKQMPVFVLTSLGEKESARAILGAMLLTGKNLHPNEVNFMKAYLEEQLGEETVFDKQEGDKE